MKKREPTQCPLPVGNKMKKFAVFPVNCNKNNRGYIYKAMYHILKRIKS